MTLPTLLFPMPVRQRAYPTVGQLSLAEIKSESGVVGYSGHATVEIEDGSTWPDVLGTGGRGPELLLSARAVDGCSKFMRNGKFEAHIVQIRAISGKLKGTKAPEYFFLNAPPGISVSCEQKRPVYAIPLRPDMKTWSGDGVVRPSNLDIPFWYVSEDVVDLAVSQKWSGIKFHPMDLGIGPHPGWTEIIPKKGWRKTLYPQPVVGTPEADARSIHNLFSSDGGISYEARLALFERGREVLPQLLSLFQSEESEDRRLRLAQVLSGMSHQGIEIPGHLKSVIFALGQEV